MGHQPGFRFGFRHAAYATAVASLVLAVFRVVPDVVLAAMPL
jgi:hypothetical protein